MFFYIKTDEKPLAENLPYNGEYKHMQKEIRDITWVFSDFPIRLRHILYKFIILHEKKMVEETDVEL